MRYTVDRIEEGIVVCEREDKTMEEFSKTLFPPQVRAGDIVEEREKEFCILEQETRERKAQIAKLMDSLWE